MMDDQNPKKSELTTEEVCDALVKASILIEELLAIDKRKQRIIRLLILANGFMYISMLSAMIRSC